MLNRLVFAGELMMFSKGDMQIVKIKFQGVYFSFVCLALLVNNVKLKT